MWQLYDEGKITMQEMLDKARQPGALHDKAKAKIDGQKTKGKKKDGGDDVGQILRT